MPLRIFEYALLLIVFTTFGPSIASQTDQSEPATEPPWEYKVVNFSSPQCVSEGLAAELNKSGEKGWELVNFALVPEPFPSNADGTLLIKPAATGPGKLNNPQTADSFEGTMSLTMDAAKTRDAVRKPHGCMALFKRIRHVKTRP